MRAAQRNAPPRFASLDTRNKRKTLTVAKHASRKEAREKALRYLYGLEFTQYDWMAGLEEYWAAEEAPSAVRTYAEALIEGVATHREKLDATIADALDNWTPDRVGVIERTAIRIALFEMTRMPNVPAAVAINEAINLVKEYGAEDAPRFVNGVLDRLRKKIEDDPALLD